MNQREEKTFPIPADKRMTHQEWKLLIAILAIFVVGGIIREFRKSPLTLPPPTAAATSPSPSPNK